MGDEKDYFDKAFSLVEKTLENHGKIQERLNKIETRLLVVVIIFSIIDLIFGFSHPVIRPILNLLFKV